MEIHAGGKVWDVETRPASPLAGEGDEFWGVTFRDRQDRGGEVAIGWIPRRGRLTTYAAHRLFELAGERLWRDPRTGVIHRVVLEDGPDDRPDAPLVVRFVTAAGSGATRYDLSVPVGLADDESLGRLLDRALRRGPGRLVTD
jgi:hypothetical protein